MEIQEPESLAPAQALATVLASQTQCLVVCGEAGAGAEAHVVQGGKQEAETWVQAAVSFPSLFLSSQDKCFMKDQGIGAV